MKSFLAHPSEIAGLLDGSQTRIVRPVVPQPQQNSMIFQFLDALGWNWKGHDWIHESQTPKVLMRECPLGKPGDRLCCKETFGYHDSHDDVIFFKADKGETNPFVQKWHSSATMKPGQSRLTLEVVSVEVKQLKDLTEADATACGFRRIDGMDLPIYKPNPYIYKSALMCLRENWHTLYYRKGYPYDGQLWVWLAEVRRVVVTAASAGEGGGGAE